MPQHKAGEQATGTKKKGGTTGQGISPCYGDKAQYRGVRLADLADVERGTRLITANAEHWNTVIQAYGGTPLEIPQIIQQVYTSYNQIQGLVCDTQRLLWNAIADGKKLLLEGAQGTMLDNDLGSYPGVTASRPTIGGACTGTGIPARKIDVVIGVVKAYVTRVGEGLLPTEIIGELQNRLREDGEVYGATTGRARRCGWFDEVQARYAAEVNGFDSIAITKPDILSKLRRIPVCIEYRVDGKVTTEIPAVFDSIEAVYEEVDGWETSIDHCRTWEELPSSAQRYFGRIEGVMNAPARIISVGPGREQTISRDHA